MASKTRIGIIAGTLIIFGLGVTLYKSITLGLPLLPEQYRDVWTIESKVTFEPSKGPVEVTLTLPEDNNGAVIEAEAGTTICDAALKNGIEIEHACEKSCACTTCHVIVREGFNSLNESDETEDDLLDKAWGLEPDSRLSCQAVLGDDDLVVEIPKYTINMVSENH